MEHRLHRRWPVPKGFYHNREGLRIYVDGEVFEAVGDITDFKVRELIRDTIREWEGC